MIALRFAALPPLHLYELQTTAVAGVGVRERPHSGSIPMSGSGALRSRGQF